MRTRKDYKGMTVEEILYNNDHNKALAAKAFGQIMMFMTVKWVVIIGIGIAGRRYLRNHPEA